MDRIPGLMFNRIMNELSFPLVGTEAYEFEVGFCRRCDIIVQNRFYIITGGSI